MPILKSIAANKKVKDKVYTQTPASLKRILEYVTRKGKDQSEVYKAYGVGLNDNIDIAFKEIMFNKRAFDKIDGRQYKHYAISYPPGFNDLETIEKIATRFVEENFLKRGFKCYISIHTDKDHYHTHIIADSVNFLNGYKLQEITEKQLLKSRYKDKELNTWELRLEELKISLEEISLEYGVPSPERNPDKAKTKNIGKMSKYKALEKDNSWRNYIARVWEETILETTTTMENLEQKLKEKGIYFNRFNAENKSLTLATEYTVGEEKKVGKIRLNKLATEEDYRFQATPNIYNWDTFMKILEKHDEKEVEEELKIEDLENIFDELEKDAGIEKEFEKEMRELEEQIEISERPNKRVIEKNLIEENQKYFKRLKDFQQEFKAGNKNKDDLEELKSLKQEKGWEFVLDYNNSYFQQQLKYNEEREKEKLEMEERIEREKQERIKQEKERLERIEDEKIRKNFEYNERHDRIRAEEKEREQERIKLNKTVEDNKFIDIKEKEIKPAAEEKEVEKTIKRKEKDWEYGE